MSGLDRVVVVGASAAGLTAAQTLRREGYAGDLVLLGDETRPPYDRPPLSKQVLSGDWAAERVALRGADVAADVLLGRRAAGLDLAARRVLLDDGSGLEYDGLVIATGVRPRRLPTGHELAGVRVLRTLDDALALRARLAERPRTVVIGAGFLGTEVAAAARGHGAAVTLVDPLPQPLFRQFGAGIGARVAALHTAHGVRVRTGCGPARPVGVDGRVVGVALGDGTIVDADLVVVAIGAVPATDWLAGSGLALGDGVECDERCAAAPGVYAAGDVASWYHPGFGRRLRLEHRMNATEQGMAVARNLLGAGAPFAPVPYFWTDQYETKLAVWGLVGADLDTALVAGDPADDSFVLLYGRHGRVLGALGWNSVRELRGWRAAVAEGAAWPADAVPVAP